jgi:hypothetical protein
MVERGIAYWTTSINTKSIPPASVGRQYSFGPTDPEFGGVYLRAVRRYTMSDHTTTLQSLIHDDALTMRRVRNALLEEFPGTGDDASLKVHKALSVGCGAPGRCHFSQAREHDSPPL